MKLYYIIILIVLFFLQNSLAQVQLSTPLEILTFMEASPTSYQLQQLEGKLLRKKKAVIPHGALIEQKEKREYQIEYKDLESKKEKRWKKKARDLIRYEKPNYKKARKLYHKILKKNPANAQIHTFIGETYYNTKQYDKAYPWFEKAVTINPIDYLARWMMAEIYLENNELDSAVKAITLAHIYNRNHSRLAIRLEQIYKKKEQKYFRDWGFEPQYYIDKKEETIAITADGIWLTYAMYKAVWEYEPDYLRMKKDQKVTDYLFQEEMEAVIGTFMTYSSLQKDDKRNYPAMNALGLCLDLEMVEEYVMYEILLPNRPNMAYHITDQFMERLLWYIKKVRGERHTQKK